MAEDHDLATTGESFDSICISFRRRHWKWTFARRGSWRGWRRRGEAAFGYECDVLVLEHGQPEVPPVEVLSPCFLGARPRAQLSDVRHTLDRVRYLRRSRRQQSRNQREKDDSPHPASVASVTSVPYCFRSNVLDLPCDTMGPG